jgi:hypothetical protein
MHNQKFSKFFAHKFVSKSVNHFVNIQGAFSTISHPVQLHAHQGTTKLKKSVVAFLSVITMISCLQSPTAAAAADGAGGAASTIPFNQTQFKHRWSKNTQHEYTPDPQTNLDAWTDMMTINVYPGVKSGESLSATANLVLSKYQEHGKIIRTDSKPKTETKPAEHLAVALLGNPKFLEAAFARFVIVNDVGYSIVYSHRVYGEKVGSEMSKWLKENGAELEKTIMDWSAIPAPDKLSQLPQSK